MVWKIMGVIGIIVIVVLALIIASPHVKPLQPIARSLGLVQTQTIYVPVNHTVVKYVNQTIVKYVYVNQTVPVYVNKTVYVYVNNVSNPLYAAVMRYVPPGIINNLTLPTLLASLNLANASFCYAKVVVLNNGTAWSAAVLGLGGSGYAKYLQNECVNSTYTENGVEYCFTYFNVGGVWGGVGTFDTSNEYVQINGTPTFLMFVTTVLSQTYDGYYMSALFAIDSVNISGGKVFFGNWAVPLNSTVLANYYFGNSPYTISGSCLVNVVGPMSPSIAEEQLLPLPLWQWFRYVAGFGNVTNYTYGYDVNETWQEISS